MKTPVSLPLASLSTLLKAPRYCIWNQLVTYLHLLNGIYHKYLYMSVSYKPKMLVETIQLPPPWACSAPSHWTKWSLEISIFNKLSFWNFEHTKVWEVSGTGLFAYFRMRFFQGEVIINKNINDNRNDGQIQIHMLSGTLFGFFRIC